METFAITLNQMIKLFAFMVCGFVLQKKVLPDSTGGVLSKLEVNVFLPALCFNTFASQFHLNTFAEKWPHLLVGTVLIVVTGLAAVPASRLFGKDQVTRDVYNYSLAMPNLGYLGYPLIGAVFGEQMMLDAMLVGLPYQFYVYTVGLHILKPNRDKFTLKKLINPPMIAIGLGMIVGMLDWQVPAVLDETLTMAADCMAPVAMILSGFILGRAGLKKMLGSPKVYVATLLRLAVIPLLAVGAELLMGVKGDVIMLSGVLLGMPFGLNTVVFPEAYGGDGTVGAQLCFASNILGLASVPLLFGLLVQLM